jgi:hypothetical protein
VLNFIVVHAPGGAAIEINPSQIVLLRERTVQTGEHITKDANCQITFSDGKYITTIETCAEIKRKLDSVRD